MSFSLAHSFGDTQAGPVLLFCYEHFFLSESLVISLKYDCMRQTALSVGQQGLNRNKIRSSYNVVYYLSGL